MRIVVTGATGFIGTSLIVALTRQRHQVVALARNPETASALPCEFVSWTAESGTLEPSTLLGADAIIHLAGHPVVESRWNEQTRNRIRDSRILGTRAIVDAIAALPKDSRPPLLINASAFGLYGERGEEELAENSQAGSGFLAEVVKDWEREALRAGELGARVVLLRLGIVLGREGGALPRMQSVVLGSGRQWMSWIHIEDVVRFISFSLEDQKISGAFNLVAPEPVRNKEFTTRFANATGTRLVLKAPRIALKAVLGDMSDVLLQSAKVFPKASLAAGFRFIHTDLGSALSALYPSDRRQDSRFSSVQYVPSPLEEVFEFFSTAENLETITPPWLGFHVIRQSTPRIQEKTLIDYKLRIHGLPIRWQSLIEHWVPNDSFVDTQTRGPYQSWHHTHRFERLGEGTLVFDEVYYRLPGGKLGNLLGGAFVRRDVGQIFAFRRKRIAEIFSGSTARSRRK